MLTTYPDLPPEIKEWIEQEIARKTDPHRRRALSVRYPRLKTLIMNLRRWMQYTKWQFSRRRYACQDQHQTFLPFVIKKHQSLLRRKLGESDPQLQENKIVNLSLAIPKINKVIIAPGQKRSFRKLIGLPTRQDGYREGVVLYQGEVMKGVGGGICQLANLIYRLALHSPMTITKQYHHSYDVFPDSGRVLPFGSGATVVYNYIDLELENRTNQSFQFEVWLSDTHLCGKLRCDQQWPIRYHIDEKDPAFVLSGTTRWRYNELIRTQTDLKSGELITTEHITRNLAPVMYEISEDKLILK